MMSSSLLVVEAMEPRVFMSVSASLTDLANFSSGGGGSPYGGITRDAQGDLFGTTRSGGPYNDGSVFEIPQGSNTIIRLVAFNGTNGNMPIGNLALDSSGNLYGTTLEGGANNGGTLFKITAGTMTLTTLASFSASTTGYFPEGDLVIDSAGNIYGTTAIGVGGAGYGSLFKFSAASNTLAALAGFTGTAGRYPFGLISDASGDLFGATSNGGVYGIGNIFEVHAGSSAITQLASFDTTTGVYPSGDLMIDAAGNLYGTTTGPGAGSAGTIFELHAGSSTITRLAAFSSAGNNPVGDLVLDPAGNLYGATTAGGTYGDGSVYELTAGSTIITPLVSFNGTNGSGPLSGLTIDANGNLYGTTQLGGANNLGDVFEVSGRPTTTHLSVVSQPNANVSAGSAQAITANLLLDSGAVDTANQSVVTLQLTGGPNGGVVSYHSNATAVNGVATFSGVSFSKTGTYTLQLNSASLTSGSPVNVSVNVVAAAASRLVVATQPSAPVTVGAIGNIVVVVEDAYGNLITSDNSTLSVATSDGSALGGTLNVSAVNGVADFPDLTSHVEGNRYLIFSDGVLNPTEGNILSVTAGAPSQLAFVQDPQNAAAGGSLGAVLVSVEDAYGNPVLTDHSTVSLTSDDSSVFTSTIWATVTSGQAVFNTLKSTQPGLHTLVANDGNLTPVSSTPWITFAGPADHLAIVNQPTTADYGQTVGAITVEVLDAFGNVVTTDDSELTMTGTALGGTTSAAAQNGIALFSDLTIDANGAQVLTASDGYLGSADTAAITISSTAPAGGYFAPLTIDPSTLFPPTKAVSKWLKVELVNTVTNKIALTRTSYPKPGQSVVVNNLGSNVAGNYNVVAVNSLGQRAALEQVTVLPAAPHELWFSTTPQVLDIDSVVEVSVLDQSGNLTDGADGSTVTLHSWLPKGTSGRAPILSGTVTAVVINGVATFTGLAMNETGEAHLIARLGDLKPTVSNVFQSDEVVVVKHKGVRR